MIKKAIVAGIVAASVGCAEQDPIDEYVELVHNFNPEVAGVEVVHAKGGIRADMLRAAGVDEDVFVDSGDYTIHADGLYFWDANGDGDRYIFINDSDSNRFGVEHTYVHETVHHLESIGKIDLGDVNEDVVEMLINKHSIEIRYEGRPHVWAEEAICEEVAYRYLNK